MQFSILGSGSKGNSTIVCSSTTTLMIDNGFSLKETELRLQKLSLQPQKIDAILVTHEHQDHIKGVGPLARRYDIPVHMSHGSWKPHRLGELPQLHKISAHRNFSIGDIEVIPFPVPHDSAEACQFRFQHGHKSLTMVTDCGKPTPHIIDIAKQSDALIIECNHDSQMLDQGPYPTSLKQRVSGGWGHLSNAQAADLTRAVYHSQIQYLVAAHLSEQNNQPHLAIEVLASSTGRDRDEIDIATQENGLDWRKIA